MNNSWKNNNLLIRINEEKKSKEMDSKIVNKYKLTEEEAYCISNQKYIKVKNITQLKKIIKASMTLYGPAVDLNFIDISGLKSLSGLFSRDNGKLMNSFEGDISQWDTSNVIDISCMFSGLKNFNGDLSNWDTSNVKYMDGVFIETRSFNGDLSNWDTSNVKYMEKMFAASNFNNDSICNWDVSNVVSMYRMFDGSAFNQDISNWDVSKVHRMDRMFFFSNFDQDISNWNTSSLKARDEMFAGSAFEENGIHNIDNWNTDEIVDGHSNAFSYPDRKYTYDYYNRKYFLGR